VSPCPTRDDGAATSDPAHRTAPGRPPLPATTFERSPGAASAPVSGTYRRREPEATVLHRVVREHLETFLEHGRVGDGGGYPSFVGREFRRYLDCGILCHGFARLKCSACGHEQLVA
jgi:hypothetical protein